MPTPAFTIFPAIDLRRGSVVRLAQGDPNRQTIYGFNPAETARHWLEMGARWLHVVNLDGAFGEQDSANQQALAAILRIAAEYQAQVQFGGGLRTLEDIRITLTQGVDRVVLGTVIVEQPEMLVQALEIFGNQRIAAGIDAREGLVRVRGWAIVTATPAVDLAQNLSGIGLDWIVFTDVARDGMALGANLSATIRLSRESGLNVIASGGVNGPEDVRRARQAGLAGIIIGRALYEGKVDLREILGSKN